VRDPARDGALAAAGCELCTGDVTDAASLADIAGYLVHAIAGGAGSQEGEREGAMTFARSAKREGVGRVVYLGGRRSGRQGST
jgi:uncharacterized protein YbjT (DUF2867 family)